MSFKEALKNAQAKAGKFNKGKKPTKGKASGKQMTPEMLAALKKG